MGRCKTGCDDCDGHLCSCSCHYDPTWDGDEGEGDWGEDSDEEAEF